jgi:hypothetical protein
MKPAAPTAAAVTLSSSHTRAVLDPARGGRVQRVTDVLSGRELLQQLTPSNPRGGFTDASTGGWDELFPNDAPALGHPDHGRCWNAPFAVVASDDASVTLRTALATPAVDVERRCTLLAPPRRGVRLELELVARAATGPFLWASHPMLAVEPGWLVDVGDRALAVDAQAPGRFADGAPIDGAARTVAGAGEGFTEVLSTAGGGGASVRSPDGASVTRLAYDPAFFEHLWIVTVSGDQGLDLAMLLEPATSATYELDDAVRRGQALTLEAGARRSWWIELESLDRTP